MKIYFAAPDYNELFKYQKNVLYSFYDLTVSPIQFRKKTWAYLLEKKNKKKEGKNESE